MSSCVEFHEPPIAYLPGLFFFLHAAKQFFKNKINDSVKQVIQVSLFDRTIISATHLFSKQNPFENLQYCIVACVSVDVLPQAMVQLSHHHSQHIWPGDPAHVDQRLNPPEPGLAFAEILADEMHQIGNFLLLKIKGLIL